MLSLFSLRKKGYPTENTQTVIMLMEKNKNYPETIKKSQSLFTCIPGVSSHAERDCSEFQFQPLLASRLRVFISVITSDCFINFIAKNNLFFVT